MIQSLFILEHTVRRTHAPAAAPPAQPLHRKMQCGR
jgi:hypothetical protein